MKKFFFLFLFVATATLAQAQVSKMLGQWNTYDDKTGDLRSTVNIYEENDTYQAVITILYEKDTNGKFKVMKAPYAKEYEGVVGTKLFSEMKVHGEQLKGKIYDPESQKTYNGKVSYKAKSDELIVRGSLDKAGLLGRSQTWKRKK
ncbi:MAG: DUF2147 domain-containing protein [Bacteroidales bacterium]|nr:DUF2147 domain-containing protein [Bacteroidales bacterium]